MVPVLLLKYLFKGQHTEWQELELSPTLGTKVEPEPKIHDFGSATLS